MSMRRKKARSRARTNTTKDPTAMAVGLSSTFFISGSRVGGASVVGMAIVIFSGSSVGGTPTKEEQ